MDPHFEGVIFQSHAEELSRRLRRSFPPYRILDVRSPSSYAEGRIAGALSTSPDALARGLPAGVPQGAEIFVVGNDPFDPTVREASLALQALGVRRIVEFSGGMHAWRKAGLAVEHGTGGPGLEQAA